MAELAKYQAERHNKEATQDQSQLLRVIRANGQGPPDYAEAPKGRQPKLKITQIGNEPEPQEPSEPVDQNGTPLKVPGQIANS